MAPSCVVTELSFSDADHPQLEFNPKCYLDADDAASSVSRSKSAEVEGFCPSMNIIARATEAEPEGLIAPPPSTPALPSPPKKELQLTALADGFTMEQFLAQGWTEESLIEQGYLA